MVSGVAALRSTESWAIPVIARENIPARFALDFATHFAPDEAPYLLYNPRQDKLMQLSDEKLICLAKDRLVIFSPDRAPFVAKFEEVVCIRQEELLLAYSLQIVTSTDSITVDYNAACSDLFEPILAKIRVKGTTPKDSPSEWRKINELTAVNLKFANYTRQLVRDSGQLVDYVIQAELDLENQTVAAASLVILTETELAWVMNEEKAWAQEPVYGAIILIAPRAQVTSCTLVSAPEFNLVNLHIGLPGDNKWTIPFAAERREDLERLLKLCLTPGI